jgi:ABC-type glycerol-3-phosphate transport system substrate-binding protein
MKFLTLVFVLALSTSAFACGEGKTSDSSVKTETTKKKNSTEG